MENSTAIKATPYRVSTITCNATVATKVDLALFFEHVRIEVDKGFVWSEYGTLVKGVRMKKKPRADPSAPERTKKCFDNQVTVVYKLGEGYFPNCKLFKNGNIHLTGIRCLVDGEAMVQHLADEVCRIAKTGVPVVEDVSKINPSDFKIRMINSDFSFPIKIKRKNLHSLLIDKYKNVCSFQPLTYPGVKLQFFWNKENESSKRTGVCACAAACFGKGDDDGECKKVTIAVFHSGKTLITGANTFDQVNDAYAYICRVVSENRAEVEKIVPEVRK